MGLPALAADPGRLYQFSTRGQVLNEDGVMIAGFIIGGAAPKTVMVTVAGPSLAAFGVAHPLANPTLTLFRTADRAILATNDDWSIQNHPGDIDIISTSPFRPNEALEPAIVATLEPGAYTAVVQGLGGSTGVAVVGVFEVDHPEIPLLNLSTRARVLTGEDVMIAGFIINGTQPQSVVINVAGPSLSTFFFDPLADPVLALVRSSDRSIIATNDDWQTQAPADVAAIIASGFQPNHPKEPAIIATLQPGAYTAIASGAGGGTGIGVIGVFAANRDLTITSAPTTTFQTGQAGTFTVATTGTPAATGISYTGTLPAGVTLTYNGNGTATLAGTPGPGTGGNYPITITATNGFTAPAAQNFTLTVNQPPAITSANNTTFIVGTAGTFNVVATGFPAAALSMTGALPSGVTFNAATGVLSGTPATGTGGTYPLVFTAANGIGSNATQNFTLTINAGPVFTSANNATFTAGTLGTFTVTTTSTPVAGTITFTGTLPGGVSFTNNGNGTATIAGTPGALTGGVYPIVITANNGVAPNTQNFTLTVNQAPAITSANATTFVTGTVGNFTVVATGFPAPTFTSTGALPGGVTLSSSGVLSGNPASSGSFPIVITASNGIGSNATQNFTLTVQTAAAITSGNTTTFTAGSAGTFTVTATGVPTPTLAVTGTLPAGTVSFTPATGVLAGTPNATAGGSYPLVVTATNGVGAPATQNFTLIVNQAPAITSVNNATFTTGSVGNFAVTATGFPAPTFTFTGSLPGGVTLSPSGVLSGNPASSGSFPITITASNGIGAPATQNFTLTVQTGPAITSINNATFLAGTPGTFTVTATGVPTPTLSVTGTLPAGTVSFTPATGVLAGTPNANAGGIYPLVVGATNGVGPGATQNFTLTVNQVPAFTSGNNITFIVGTPANFPIAASGFPAPVITSTGALPTGVNFTGGTGTASLAGNAAVGTGGVYPLTFTATNIAGAPTQSFTLTIVQGSGGVDDGYSTVHDTVLNIPAGSGLVSNDTGSPQPHVVSITGTTTCAAPCTASTTHGSVNVLVDGSFTYTPAANYAGPDTFTYISDNGVTSGGATVTITVTDIPAVVDLNGAGAGIDFGPTVFTESAGPVLFVDPTLTLTDADGTMIADATITITNPLDQPNEFLTVTCTGPGAICSGAILNTDISYAPVSGTLLISRVAPLADYEALLRTLRYNNTSLNPTTTTRVISVEVNDRILDNSPLAFASVSIIAVNNAPVLTAPATATTATNTAKVFSGAVISVSDVDAGTGNVTVTIAATNGTATLATTTNLSVTGNGTASVSATGPLSDLNNALNGLTFTPTAAYSGPATLVLNANDNGNTGTGGAQSAVQKTINITVDNPPTVVSTVPANGATLVATTTGISVTFSEAVTATASAFTLQCPVGTPILLNPVSPAALPALATTFTFSTAGLPQGASCTLTVVANQVTDSVGQNMAANSVSTFTANTRPTVVSTVPTNGATGINLTSTIAITFSESVNATGTAFTLECPAAAFKTFGQTGSPATIITLTPSLALPSGTLCTVTVVAAQVTDADASQPMSANFVFSFTTGTPPNIGSVNNATFTVGSANTFTVTTTGAPTVTSIVQGGATLPTGVTFSYTSGANGTLASGAGLTAAGVGSYAISFTASNGITPDAVQPFTLNVVCPSIALGPANGTVFAAGYNTVFTQTYSPSGGSGSYTYTLGGAALPGPAFSGNDLTGTLTNTGSFAFTVKATDANGCSSPVQNYTLNVNPVLTGEAINALANVIVDYSSGTPLNLLANDSFPAGGTNSLIFDSASASGGTVVVTTAAGPNFGKLVSYDPPVGFAGPTDTFTYTLTSNGRSAVGTVTVTVSGPVVWFVKDGGGACSSGLCDGRMSHPFTDMSTFQTANGGGVGKPAANQAIFVYGTGTNYSGAATLLAGQRLIGQGAISSLTTLTGATAQNGQTLPSMLGSGSAPTLLGSVALPSGGNNFLQGIVLGGSPALSGTSFGTLTVNENTSINTTGQAINFPGGGTLSGGFLSITSSGGGTNISAGGIGTVGTFDFGNGTLTGASIGFGLNTTFGDFTYSGTIAASSQVVSLSNMVSGSWVFSGGDMNSAGTPAGGIQVSNKSGGNLTFSGNVYLATTRTISLTNTGGNITFLGSINPTGGPAGGGISVSGSTAGTILFSGAEKRISTGTSAGVNLATNTGATISFTNGGLAITTTSGKGFTATGGGTVTVEGANNTITSTTGTALEVTSTTIGANDLTFLSISANGGTNGIVLNNTGSSGGLFVTGDGGSSNNFSGGTIQGTTGAGILLTTTRDISLDQMRIINTQGSGIEGTGVTNFAVTNSTFSGNGNATWESAISFNNNGAGTGNNVAGTLTVTGNSITNPFFSGLDVQSDNGTVSDANVSGNTITNPGFSGINFVGIGTATTAFNLTKATINQNNVLGSGGNGIQVNVGNSNVTGPGATAGSGGANIVSITNNSITLDTGGTNAIIMSNSGGNAGSRTTTNFLVQCNGKNSGGCTAPTAAPLGSSDVGTIILIGNNGYSDMTGTVNNNAMVATHTPNFGGGNGIAGGNGVAGAGNAWTPNLTLSVTNNTISGTDGNGILLVGRGTSAGNLAGNSFKLKIDSNTVGMPVNVGGTARQGIRVDAGNPASADDAVCLKISNNVSAGSNGAAGLGVRKQGAVAGTNDFGLHNIPQNPPLNTDVQNFINGLNGSGGGTDIISGSSYVQCNSAP